MAANYTADGKLDMKNANAETILAFFHLCNQKLGKPITTETVRQFFETAPEFQHLQDDVEALLFGTGKRGFRWNT